MLISFVYWFAKLIYTTVERKCKDVGEIKETKEQRKFFAKDVASWVDLLLLQTDGADAISDCDVTDVNSKRIGF